MKLAYVSIVRDDERTIEKSLKSVKNVVDEMIVVVDSRSKDKTREIVKKYTDKVYEYDWKDKNFSDVRNYAVSLTDADFVLMIDGDESLAEESQKVIREEIEKLSPEVLEILPMVKQFNDNSGVPVYILRGHRLYKNNGEIKWIGQEHEHLNTPVNRRKVSNTIIINHDKTQKRESDKKRSTLKDMINMHRKKLAENPEDVRQIFKIANLYKYSGNVEKAIEEYEKYLKVATWGEEIYQAKYFYSQCLYTKGMLHKAYLILLDAIEIVPERAEAYIALGQICHRRRMFSQAILWFREAISKEIPTSLLFIEGAAYSHLPYDLLSLSYYKIGKIKEALKAAEKALSYNEKNERIKDNIKLFREKLADAESKK